MLMRKQSVFLAIALSFFGVVGCSDIPSAPDAPSRVVASSSKQPVRTLPGSVTTSSTLSAYVDGSHEIDFSGYHMWGAVASGGTGTYSYQWQHRVTTSGTWNNVGTNSHAYERYVGPNSVPFYLRVIVTSGSYSFTSAQFLVRNCQNVQIVDCPDPEV